MEYPYNRKRVLPSETGEGLSTYNINVLRKKTLFHNKLLSVLDVYTTLCSILNLDTLEVVDLTILNSFNIFCHTIDSGRSLLTEISQTEVINTYPVFLDTTIFLNTD